MVRPCLNYYGSKWRAAKLYPPPTHDVIVEPFAGGAGYSCLYADRNIVLVEKDARVVKAWQYLIKASADEILDLPDVVEGQHIDTLEVEDGARYLISCWLGRGGFRRIRSKWANNKERPNDSRYWGPERRAILAEQVPMIRHWIVVEGSYADVPELGVPATWFVDPPYNNTAGAVYTFGPKDIDYGHLAEWCRGRPDGDQVLVCENAGASWLPFEPLATWGGVGARKTEEVLWVRPG